MEHVIIMDVFVFLWFFLGLWKYFIAAFEHRWFHYFWKYGRVHNTNRQSFQWIPVAKNRILYRTQAFVCIEQKQFKKKIIFMYFY